MKTLYYTGAGAGASILFDTVRVRRYNVFKNLGYGGVYIKYKNIKKITLYIKMLEFFLH
jgi:hypothetical protein